MYMFFHVDLDFAKYIGYKKIGNTNYKTLCPTQKSISINTFHMIKMRYGSFEDEKIIKFKILIFDDVHFFWYIYLLLLNLVQIWYT